MEGLNKHFKYMHNNGIIHRDLNPENIMIKYVDSSKTNYIRKIGDYGISKELDNGKTPAVLGTIEYMTPEIKGIKYIDKSALFFNSLPFQIQIVGSDDKD